MSQIKPNVDEIFLAALEKNTAEERTAYLDEVCGDDADLRNRVERLLEIYPRLGDFMERPPGGRTATVEFSELSTSLATSPGMVIGRYKLLQQIGEGGFGVVFMAQQREPMVRKVALKIIKPGMDSKEVIARFEAERQALAMMNHPHIAAVLDAGTTDAGRPYFVMELVRGIPITDYCEENSLTIGERLDLFLSICQAVQHAHQKGIIHRDLKPSNVLVTLYDGTPVVKVIDFGVAKALNQQLTERTLFTRFAQVIGTPLYMSPEQAELSGLDIDTRSDIYSLGVLLYELLTACTPFEPDRLRTAALDEMRRIIREEEPPKPSTKIKTLGKKSSTVAQHRKIDASKLTSALQLDLDWIVMKALEKDRARRYDTAKDLADDIMRHLEHQPVVAGPPSTTYRLSKYVKRHKAAVATISTFVATLLFGFVALSLVSWDAIQSRIEADEARIEAEEARRIAEENEKNAIDSQNEQIVLRQEADRAIARAVLGQADHEFRNRDGNQAMALLASAMESAERSADQDLVSHILRQVGAWLPHVPRLEYMAEPSSTIGASRRAILSPDTTVAACIGTTGALSLWNTDTGSEISDSILKFHFPSEQLAVTYPVSMNYDNTLVILRNPMSVFVVDIGSGQLATSPITFTSNAQIHAVAFSPDNRYLAVGEGSRVHLFDSATWEPIGSPMSHRSGVVTNIVFSPDGEQMVSCCTDAILWRITDGLEIVHRFHYPGVARSAALSPKGSILAIGGDKGVCFWNINRLAPVSPLIPHSCEVSHLDFSSDGDMILTSDHTGAQIWNSSSGLPMGLKMFHSGIQYAKFNPDASLVYTVGGPDVLRAWRVERHVPLASITVQGGWGGGNFAFARSAERAVFLSFSSSTTGTTASLVNTRTGEQLEQIINCGHSEAFVAGGHLFICAHGARVANRSGRHIYVSDVDRPPDRPLRDPVEVNEHVQGVALSERGDAVAAVLGNNTISIWDVETTAIRFRKFFRCTDIGFGAQQKFSPCGHFLALASPHNPVRLWDLNSGKERTLWFHEGGHHKVAFSRDGSRLGVASNEVCVVWDIASNRRVGPYLKTEGYITSMDLSSNGDLAVTGGRDGMVRIWDVREGRTLGPPIRYFRQVRWVGFGEDDQTVQCLVEERLETWPLGESFHGNHDAIRSVVAAKLGIELEDGGRVRYISREEWQVTQEEAAQQRER